MKFKRIMLVTFVLLAILTIGAVSAADDINANETLTADNVEEVSVDASVDDLISESGDEVIAASEDDVQSLSTSIDMDVEDVYEGETIFFEFYVREFNDSGIVNLSFNGNTYAAGINGGGYGWIEIRGNVEPGIYQATAVHYPSGASVNKTVEILPKETNNDDSNENEGDSEIYVNVGSDEKIYTDEISGIVSVSVPQNRDGTIFVEVDGEQRADWVIEHYDEDSLSYHEWGLEDLGITEADDYEIVVKLDEEILANETITVYEFENNTFRAFLDYDNELIQLYCPEGSEGNLTVITYVETGKETYEAVFNETYDVAEYPGWTTWNLENIGFERTGFWLIFTFTVSNGTDELCVLNKGYSYEENGEGDDGDERFYIPGEININNPNDAVVYIN